MQLYSHPVHLGDGAYASFDGYQIWLHTERDGREHCVALEPHVFAELIKYQADLVRHYWEKARV